MNPDQDPHRGQPVLAAGADPTAAKAAMIMLHGRGADAADILALAGVFRRGDVAFIAPEAAGRAWYPYRFFMPAAQNEPYLSSALNVIATLLASLAEDGIPQERCALLGFSQGACLALEYAARQPRRYGAVIALSGGLIGDRIDPADYAGSLDGTPVFIGCSDVDQHIPVARVRESAEVMRRLGGKVAERIYPGMGHTINEDETAMVGALIDALVASPTVKTA